MRYVRPTIAAVLALVAAFAIAACGSSHKSSSGGSSGTSTSASSGGTNGGTITIDAGTSPNSADNGYDFTTQGNELYSTVDTPLLVFKRGVQGAAGTQIMPGLAKALPTVSDGGKTYTFQLRSGLKFSNGMPIKASDETYALERDLKIPWQAGSFVSGYIVGAEAYAKGKSKTISGITTDNATGTIKVHLVSKFAPIVDIFALAGTAPVPPNTPMHNLASTGTIGDGPYKWSSISPGRTYTLVKNTSFNGVPTVPTGHADKIVFNVNSNVLADAQAVLNNQADVFDPGDTLPASIVRTVETTAKSRFESVPFNSTFYFFLAVNQKPFSNAYARQAVLAAIDDRALSRLDSGFLTPDCHLLPSGVQGAASPSSCPYHAANAAPNMTEAKALMKKSGMIGQKVVVWGENRSPREQYVDYFTQVLNSLGFKASEKIISSNNYFTTIGNPSTKPQAGFGDWVQDFPNPWDFMQLLAGNAGPELNYGYVNDPYFNKTLVKLYQQDPNKVASQWQALNQYVTKNAFLVPYGHEGFPKFFSDKLNFASGAVTVGYELDLTSLELK